MANTSIYENIPAEKFQFAKKLDLNHDKKFDTKPVSYFQGAFRRFCINMSVQVQRVTDQSSQVLDKSHSKNHYLRIKLNHICEKLNMKLKRNFLSL